VIQREMVGIGHAVRHTGGVDLHAKEHDPEMEGRACGPQRLRTLASRLDSERATRTTNARNQTRGTPVLRVSVVGISAPVNSTRQHRPLHGGG
jgi:hypothetical protein